MLNDCRSSSAAHPQSRRLLQTSLALLLLLLSTFCQPPFLSFFFFWNKKILIFQRDKGRKKEELAAAKQQLHLQTRGHYNEAAEALPRQHTGRWRGNMVTHWQRRQEGGGRVAGNKGRKRQMEVVILGVFTCSSRRCLPGRCVDLTTDLPYQSASWCLSSGILIIQDQWQIEFSYSCLEVLQPREKKGQLLFFVFCFLF